MDGPKAVATARESFQHVETHDEYYKAANSSP